MSLKKIISELTGRHNLVMDKVGFHKDRANHHYNIAGELETEARRLLSAIAVLKELPQDMLEEEAEEASPFQEEEADGDVDGVPDGFDRAAVQRFCQATHVRYPLAPTYKKRLSAFIKQTIIGECQEAPGYYLYVQNGGHDLTERNNRTIGVVLEVVEALGLDLDLLTQQAVEAHQKIFSAGEPGVDYQVRT